MPISKSERIWISTGEQLIEGNYLRMEVEYAGEIIPVVVFRYKGVCKAFRNLCVHMPRQLDCELGTIFDSTGKYLRCSMHGIVYDPLSGISVGTICNGEKLTSICIVEDQQGVWIQDIRVKSSNSRDTST
ncbi:MAG: Rieske 2Fe-2S domain-containing protein [Gallionella sp.]